MTNEILQGMEYDELSGALIFKGVRYFILRPETVMGMFKALVETVGWEKSGEIFYKGGYEGGRASTLKFRDNLGLSPREAAEFMCKMGGQIGWGKFELEVFDSQSKSIQVVVKNSPFAEAWLDAGRPVCHFIRGVVGGIGGALFETAVPAQEKACLAQGDDVCRFTLQG